MTEKDREKRYKNADEVISDIKKFIGTFGKKKKFKILNIISWSVALVLFIIVGLSIRKIYSTKRILESDTTIQKDTVVDTIIIKEEVPVKIEQIAQIPKEVKKEKEVVVYLNVTPYGKIFFDDQFVGECPPLLEKRVKPGKHMITIKNPKLPEIKKEIEINESSQININLIKEVAYLKVVVNPWAEVWLNGNYYATTPIADPIILLPGVYELKLRNPYYKEHIDTINLNGGDTLNIKFSFEK